MTGVARDSAVRVSWTAPADDGGNAITDYLVTASPGDATAYASAPDTSVLVSGLTNGTAYTFTVAAENGQGTGAASALSAPVTPQPAVAASPVQNLTVLPGNGQATVSWQPPASDGGADLTSTIVMLTEVSDNSSSYVQVAVPTTTATIANLIDGAAYTATVWVQSSALISGATVVSPQFTPKAGPQPGPPALVMATPGVAQATVSWTAPADDGGSPVTGYTVTTYDRNNAVVGTPISATAATTTATVTGLTNAASYYFGVTAANSAGTGPQLYSTPVTPAGPPAAPTDVTPHPSNRSVYVSWTPPANDGGSPVTSYVVTAVGTSSTLTKTVSSPNALFSGLENGTAYTFSATAANAVAGSGQSSAPSSAVAPTGQSTRPSGTLVRYPQPQSPTPDTRYVEARQLPVMSGNGRYIFYYGALYAENLDGSVRNQVRNGWYRYDLSTATTDTVWEYPVGTTYPIPQGRQFDRFGERMSPAVASYDGQVFASQSGPNANMYVWRADTGQVTLASANASGGPTTGYVGAPALSADGSTLVFAIQENADMADHTACPAYGSHYGDMDRELVQGGGDIYRFDTAGKVLTRIRLSMTALAPDPTAPMPCMVPTPWEPAAVSADGRRIAKEVDYWGLKVADGLQCPGGGYEPTMCGFTEQLGVFDVASDGSTTGTWLARQLTPASPPDGAQGYTWMPRIGMSDDGKTVGAVLRTFPTDRPEQDSLVTLDPAAPNAAPVAVAGIKWPDDWGLTGDGKKFRVGIRPGGWYDQAPQAGVIDVASRSLTVASQVNGALADAQPSFARLASNAVDATARKMVMDTTSPNMLGVGGCQPDPVGGSGCAPDLVVVDLLTGAVGMLPNQTLGCGCGSSLAATAALQNFAGDPVNTATGSYTESVDDASLPGVGLTFDFRRVYNSAAAGVSGPLGPGWTHPYAMFLRVGGNGDATLTAEDGAQAVFVKQADGSFQAPPGVGATLATGSGGYTLTLPDTQVDTFNATGQLAAMRDRDGRALTFGYSGGLLTSVTDSGGRKAVLGYDGANRIASLTMPDGRVTGYGYDGPGRLTSVTDPAGKTTTYAYDADNRLITITDPDGHPQVQNAYDPATGRVTGQTEAGGAEPRMAWDAAGEVATVTEDGGRVSKDYYSGNVLIAHVDPAGGRTSYGYDAELHLVAVTDPAGNTTTMAYDAVGNMTSRTAPYPLSYTEYWTYDSHRNLLSYTDGRGNKRVNTYDTANRVISSTDPEGGTYTYGYTTGGQLATVTDPIGKATSSTYDSAGNLTSKTDALGNLTTYAYDAAGHLTAVVDPRGNVAGADPAKFTTAYTYDAAGRVATITDPDGRTTTDSYDPAGDLTAQKDPAGNTTTYVYDTFHRQVGKTDPNGHTTTTTYSPQGELLSLTDAVGAKTTYTYDTSGRLTSMTDPRGNVQGANPAAYTTAYTYDANGDQLSSADPLGHVTRQVYDALGRVVATIDPAGGITVRAYDADGNVIASTDPAGATTADVFDKNNRPASVTDPTGATIRYAYDADGRTLSETSPLGETTSWTYDADGHILTAVDARGNVAGADKAAYTTTYGYDAAGNQIAVTDPLGHKTAFAFDPANLTTSVTDPAGNITAYGYDAAGRRSAVTDARGHTTTSAFDPAGNLTATVDPLGDKTSHTYDAADRQATMTSPRGNAPGATAATYTTAYGYDMSGNRVTVTGPTGAVTTTSYDADSRVVSVTDPLGHTMTTVYDAAGDVSSVKEPDGATRSNVYDKGHRLASATDALGKTTTFTRDPAGRLLIQTAPMGDVKSWTYDADGRTVSYTEPRGNTAGANKAAYTTTYGYDAAGNQTTVTDALGHTATTSWDATGAKSAVTDPSGRTTRYAYDVDGRLVSVTDPANAVTAYTYDSVANPLTRVDADNHTTGYGYDADNRLTSVTDPLGQTLTYAYDADGHRTTTINRRGQTVATTFDPRGLPTGTSYSDGTAPTSYTYDTAGRMTAATDSTGSHTLSYNAAGRLAGVTQPGGGAFAYSYDAAGDITGRTYPDGASITYGYDADSRPTSQTSAGATTAFAYDVAGNLTGVTYPSTTGATEKIGYDAAGRLNTLTTARSGSAVGTWQITRDESGRPTAVSATHAGTTADTSYTYDPAGRLTSACPAIGTGGLCTSAGGTVPGVTYSYDKVGNRLTQSVSASGGAPVTTTYSYDAADELTSAGSPSGTVTHAHDADGNQIDAGRTFDAANRISSQKAASGATVAFAYDAFGNRASEKQGSATVMLTWDTNSPMAQLATRSDGTGTADYLPDPLGRTGQANGPGGPVYLLHDWQNNVTDTVDASGKPAGAQSADFDPFGLTSTDIGALDSGLTGYASQTVNPDATTYDLRARQYDPATGRFLSRDPLTRSATDPATSSYVYADDAPTYQSDLSGLTPQTSVPGDGWWSGGSTYQHDFTLEMAWEQEVGLHGVENVYADFAGGHGVLGGGARLSYPTYWTKTAYPDLVVAGVPTPRGTGYAVWDVKPASVYGRSQTASVDKLKGYANGLGQLTGQSVVPGDPVTPETRIYPTDAFGAEGVMLMFNGRDWDTFHIPAPKPNGRYPAADIAPIADTDGLIYYRLVRFGKNQGTGARTDALIDLLAEGAELKPDMAIFCRSTGIPDGRTANPLRYVGQATGADISSLVDATALTAFPPGPIHISFPRPLPVTVGEGNAGSGAGYPIPAWGWGAVGGVTAAVGAGLLLTLPEAEIPLLLEEGAVAGAQALWGLAA
ncbi:RHS repeat-associated protein [Catenulispora sp. GAS73]